MTKRILLFLYLALDPSISRSQETIPASKQNISFGLLVHYSANLKKADLDLVHQKLALQIEKRFKKWNVDWVIPLGKDPFLSALQAARYCSAYEKIPLVIKCELNRKLIFNARPFEPRHEGTANFDDENKRGTEPSTKLCDDLLADEERGVPPLAQGQLTAFWAQHQIGADLVPELLKQVPEARPVPIGVYDSGFQVENLRGNLSPALKDAIDRHPEQFSDPHPDKGGPLRLDSFQSSHGDNVANLINSANSNLPVGVGHLSQILHAVPTLYESDAGKIPLDGVKIANVSLGWGDEPIASDQKKTTRNSLSFAQKVFTSLKERGTIVVFASGNDYPAPVNQLSKIGILVGSSAPDGAASDFSQEDAEVAVLAPSDHFITSLGKGDAPHGFSGTSGAAPLVTGSLDVPVSLLEGLTQEEARKLLKGSSTPAFNSRQQPQRNGTGILNQYRMDRVALRLKGHWPANREALNDPTTFDFTEEAKTKKKEALGLLAHANCDDQKKGFSLLRQSFFLAPGDRETGQQLAKIYRNLRRPKNAQFFENLDLDDNALAEIVRRNLTVQKEPNAKIAALEEASEVLSHAMRNFRGPEAIPLLTSIARDYPRSRSLAMETLAQMGQIDELKPYLSSPDPQVRQDLAKAFGKFRPSPPLDALTELAKDKNGDVAISSLIGAAALGFRARPVFDQVLDQQLASPKDETQTRVLKNLIRGSRVLADKRDEFLRGFAEKAPELFPDFLDELVTQNSVDFAPLIQPALVSTNNSVREHAEDQLLRFLRKEESKITKEQETFLTNVIGKNYRNRNSAEKIEIVQLMARLGDAGTNKINSLFNFESAEARVPILKGLRRSGEKSDQENIFRRTLTENAGDPENLIEAVLFFGEKDPERLISLFKNPSNAVRLNIIRSIPNDSKVILSKNYLDLLEDGLKTPDNELTESAIYAMAAAENKTINLIGLKSFSQLPEVAKHLFLKTAVKNPLIREETVDEMFKRTETQPLLVDALVSSASKATGDEVSGMIEAILTGPDLRHRAAFINSFLASEEIQSNARNLSPPILLAIASEWENRGYPKNQITTNVLKLLSYSKDPAIKEIVAKYRAKTGEKTR